jgi:hypothetical protein
MILQDDELELFLAPQLLRLHSDSQHNSPAGCMTAGGTRGSHSASACGAAVQMVADCSSQGSEKRVLPHMLTSPGHLQALPCLALLMRSLWRCGRCTSPWRTGQSE